MQGYNLFQAVHHMLATQLALHMILTFILDGVTLPFQAELNQDSWLTQSQDSPLVDNTPQTWLQGWHPGNPNPRRVPLDLFLTLFLRNCWITVYMTSLRSVHQVLPYWVH